MTGTCQIEEELVEPINERDALGQAGAGLYTRPEPQRLLPYEPGPPKDVSSAGLTGQAGLGGVTMPCVAKWTMR